MRRWIGGLVEVDDAVLDVGGNVAGQGRSAGGDGGVVGRAHIEGRVVLQQERPAGGVEGGGVGRGFDDVH